MHVEYPQHTSFLTLAAVFAQLSKPDVLDVYISCFQHVFSLLRLNCKDVVCRADLGGGSDAYDAGEVDDMSFVFLAASVFTVAQFDAGRVRLQGGREGGRSIWRTKLIIPGFSYNPGLQFPGFSAVYFFVSPTAILVFPPKILDHTGFSA